MRRGVALLSVFVGGRILWRVFFPGRLADSQRAALAAVLDTLIPDGRFPGARRTGVLEPLLAECAATRQTQRALIEGVELIDAKARRRGAASFAVLAESERAAVLGECASAEIGSLPWFFFRTLRDRAMHLHYTHPLARAAVGLDRPPQPLGYVDYWQAPHA